ncbi:MAG TPA: LysM peptidoglycan-binding domain-containing protein [Terrimicrobiaceae bacterium]
MKRILKMPLRRMPRRTPPGESLRAKTAATATGTADNEEDYEAEEEPSMKFSHALMVVLALHVIAVGGVFAFNSIKAGQSSASKVPNKGENASPPVQAAAQSKPKPAQGAAEGWTGKTHIVQAGDTLSRIATLYKTSVEAIEKQNGITTYSMIRVGQVLQIPVPETPIVKPLAAKPATDPVASAKHAFLAAKTEVAKPPTAAPKTDVAKLPVAAAKVDTQKSSATAAVPPKPANAQPSPKKPETPSPTTDDNVYVVAKGDNPYNIAKKLHVSYNDLIAINEIKDPTRIQIGQKLKIPAKKN